MGAKQTRSPMKFGSLAGALFLFAAAGAARLGAAQPEEIDPSFRRGNGPNSNVSSIVRQKDRKILIAGPFTKFNGNTVLPSIIQMDVLNP